MTLTAWIQEHTTERFRERFRIIVEDFILIILILTLYFLLTLFLKIVLPDLDDDRKALIEGAHFWYSFALIVVFMVNSFWTMVFPKSLWESIAPKLPGMGGTDEAAEEVENSVDDSVPADTYSSKTNKE